MNKHNICRMTQTRYTNTYSGGMCVIFSFVSILTDIPAPIVSWMHLHF